MTDTADTAILVARLLAAEETAKALLAEVLRLTNDNERLRGEVGAACRMFSRFTHRGRLDMPSIWHEDRGRRMAGLKSEPEPSTSKEVPS